jgi:Fas apoptotic inhibitory molecule (FAIM1)
MAESIWQIQSKSGTHKVRLEHAYWSGKATIMLDGETIYHRHRKIIDFGLKKAFTVDGIECLVCVIPTPWLTFWYWFYVDDKKQKPLLNSALEPTPTAP